MREILMKFDFFTAYIEQLNEERSTSLFFHIRPFQKVLRQ